MEIFKCYLIKNDCYKAQRYIKPTRIVVHSTGANNTALKRYVQPDDGILGLNKFNNHWNKAGVKKCVNAFIGKDKAGVVRVYQTLPWTMRPWGCGSGKKGSFNNNAIQFEICEDNLKDEVYFNSVMDKAAELCAYLCKEYNIKVSDVVSHHEAYKLGYASGHSDIDHWLKKHKKTMDWFRDKVKAKISVNAADKITSSNDFKVKVNTDALNVRTGAGTKYAIASQIKDRGTYTISEVNGDWGKLKSGAGWINLKYTVRV